MTILAYRAVLSYIILMEKSHTYEMTVREQYLDTYGHVNNANYLVFYEEARWEMITMNGMGLKETLAEHVGPVILEARVTYRKELSARDRMTISRAPPTKTD